MWWSLLALLALPAPRCVTHAAEPPPVFLPTDSEVETLSRRLEIASERGEWDVLIEGLETYAKLADPAAPNTVVDNGGPLALGARAVLARLIPTLPAPARARYRERADAILAAAWRETDPDDADGRRRLLRRRIVRDHPESALWREALVEEFDDALAQGDTARLRRAALHLAGAEGEGTGPRASMDRVRALTVLAQLPPAGAEEDALLRARLQALLQNGDERGDAVTADSLSPVLARAARAALARAPTTDARAGPAIYSAAQPDAAAAGTRAADRYELGDERFRSTPVRSRLRPWIEAHSREALGGDSRIPFHASADRELFVFQHVDRIEAIDRSTLQRRWSLDLEMQPDDFAAPRAPLLGATRCFFTTGHRLDAVDLLSGRSLWSWAVEYDRAARRVTLRRQTEAGEETREEGGRPAPVVPSDPSRNEEKPAVEGTEGDAAAPPQIWLTSPVFAGNSLVVGVQIYTAGESLHYVAALDADANNLWFTLIGSTRPTNYLAQRSAASLPLVIDGTVFLLTNQGILAAVDVADGAILWLREYERLGASGAQEAIRSTNRWQPNPLIVVGEQLLAGPRDATQLFSLDTVRGELLWQTARQHDAMLIGADANACYVSGSRIAAIGIHGELRGRALWSVPTSALDFSQLGRGLVTPEALYVPGRRSLLAISPQNGAVLSRTVWGFKVGGGNLLLAGDQLAVTTPEACIVYGTRAEQEARLGALPEGKVESLLERVRYCLTTGEIERGLAFLRAWHESAPTPPSPNSELDRLQLDVAEIARQLSETEDGRRVAGQLLEMRVRLERTTERRVRAAIDLAHHLRETGDVGGALRWYHHALAFDNPSTSYSPDGVLAVSSQAYIRHEILKLRRSTAARLDLCAALEKEAAGALAGARAKATPAAYQEVLRIYPYTRAAQETYLDLFVLYQDRQSDAHALQVLEDYLQVAAEIVGSNTPEVVDPREVVRVKLLRAGLLYRLARKDAARWALEDLLANHGDERVENVPGMTAGETVREYVRARLRDPGLERTAAEDDRPPLRFPIRLAWRSPADLRTANRTFLEPDGDWPAALRGHFLTQSVDQIECRTSADGLPLWTVRLDLIPGFQLEGYFPFRTRFGNRVIRGRFVDQLLVLYDPHNVFAIEAVTGSVRWHVPVGADTGDVRRLSEEIRGAAADENGVAVVTSRQLLRFSLSGERLWESAINYNPGYFGVSLTGSEVSVHSQRPPGIQIHDLSTGSSVRFFEFFPFRSDAENALQAPPIVTRRGQLLLRFTSEIALYDPGRKRILWSFSGAPRSETKDLAYFEDAPNECVVVINRTDNWPAVIGVSLDRGDENWRYEKFTLRAARFRVLRDRSQFFVLHGDVKWSLVALEIRPATEFTPAAVVPIWDEPIDLGTFYSEPRELQFASDSVLFPAPNENSLYVFDRVQRSNRLDGARPIRQFLLAKRSFASSVRDGRLILLTDSGDGAFESISDTGAAGFARAPDEANVDMELVDRFLENPGDFATVKRLGLEYFRRGDLKSALHVLNRSLLSEELLVQSDRKAIHQLAFLLNGIKEELVKSAVPDISSHRMSVPPVIDGELNDGWELASRVRIDTPLNVGAIPNPGQSSDWDGEEDLSAHLYTGWDDEYFYFVLDVRDDVLHPYDRDAENWKGDCLLIGVDPTGDGKYSQQPDDKLMTLALTVPKRKKNDKDKDRDDQQKDGEEQDEDDEEDADRDKPDGKFSVKRKPDDSGAIYEVALPWASFSHDATGVRAIRAAPGLRFGLSLLLTDDDTGQGATKTLSLNSCLLLPRSQKDPRLWHFIVPQFFPTIRLE